MAPKSILEHSKTHFGTVVRAVKKIAEPLPSRGGGRITVEVSVDSPPSKSDETDPVSPTSHGLSQQLMTSPLLEL